MTSPRKTCWAMIGLLWGAASFLSAADYPSWWISRGVVDTNVTVTNDFSVLTQGQAKQLATQAYNELEANLPRGAGSSVAALVNSFSLTNGNYLVTSVGALKNTAKPFYDRLIQVGYTTNYPWSATTSDDYDAAVANVGQAKALFSFDVTFSSDGANGLPNWWQNFYFGSTGHDPNSDPTGSGFTLQQDYYAGINPLVKPSPDTNSVVRMTVFTPIDRH